MKRKALVVAEFPAPYRVEVFNELCKEFHLIVFFDTQDEKTRSKDYSVYNMKFQYSILDSKEGKEAFWKEIRHIKQYDFALVYNFCIKYGVLLFTAAEIFGVPTFLNADGGFVNRHPIKDIIKRFIVSNCNMYFSSGSSADKFFYTYRGRQERLHHHRFTSLTKADIRQFPVEDQERIHARLALGLQTDKKYVIAVGQFIHRKGFDLLLEGWGVTDTDSVLLLIGGGEDLEKYKSILQDRNYKERVKLINFMDKSRLINYYVASDLFVLPTREDVWGLVINEAMAIGLPIVSTTQCIAAVELVDNGINGYVVNVDKDEICNRINELLGNDELRRTMACNNVIKMQGCTMENIALSHIDCIRKYFGD